MDRPSLVRISHSRHITRRDFIFDVQLFCISAESVNGACVFERRTRYRCYSSPCIISALETMCWSIVLNIRILDHGERSPGSGMMSLGICPSPPPSARSLDLTRVQHVSGRLLVTLKRDITVTPFAYSHLDDARFPGQKATGFPPSPSRENPGQVSYRPTPGFLYAITLIDLLRLTGLSKYRPRR